MSHATFIIVGIMFVEFMLYLLFIHNRCNSFQLCKCAVFISPFISEYCKEVFCCPEFKTFLVRIIVGPNKCMRFYANKICDELWKGDEFGINSESKFCDDSYSDGDIVKFVSDSKHSYSSDDEDTADGDSDMQHGTWKKVGAG